MSIHIKWKIQQIYKNKIRNNDYELIKEDANELD